MNFFRRKKLLNIQYFSDCETKSHNNQFALLDAQYSITDQKEFSVCIHDHEYVFYKTNDHNIMYIDNEYFQRQAIFTGHQLYFSLADGGKVQFSLHRDLLRSIDLNFSNYLGLAIVLHILLAFTFKNYILDIPNTFIEKSNLQDNQPNRLSRQIEIINQRNLKERERIIENKTIKIMQPKINKLKRTENKISANPYRINPSNITRSPIKKNKRFRKKTATDFYKNKIKPQINQNNRKVASVSKALYFLNKKNNSAFSAIKSDYLSELSKKNFIANNHYVAKNSINKITGLNNNIQFGSSMAIQSARSITGDSIVNTHDTSFGTRGKNGDKVYAKVKVPNLYSQGGSGRLGFGHTSQLKVGKDINKNLLLKILNRNLKKIRYCYERTLISEPGLQGTLNLKWNINPVGKVTAINVISSGLGNQSLHRCVMGKIKSLRFKGVGSGAIKYPFNFTSYSL